MSHGQGRLFRPIWNGRTSAVWWLDYSVRGQRHRESSGTTSRREAARILRHRLGDRETGKLVGRPELVTLHMLRELVERQYTLDGRRSLTRVRRSLAHIKRILGAEALAVEIGGAALDEYAATRLGEGAQRSTINQELAALRRGFRLAIEKGLLVTMPLVKLPRVHNARRGFFEPGDFAALELELPAYLRPVIRFARLTGWRVHKEILPLTWDAVDWDGQVLRLHQADTKGGEARTFPFGEAPELKQLLEGQRAARDGLLVFHRRGRRIRDFRTAWENACVRTGLGTRDPRTKRVTLARIPHDLRRTAARDLRRAGVSEGEIMKLCGWRTRSMFDRYNIIDEADLSAAVAKRFGNGKRAASSDAPAPAEG